MTRRRPFCMVTVLAALVILAGCTWVPSPSDDSSPSSAANPGESTPPGETPPESTPPGSTPGISVPPESSASPEIDPATVRLPGFADLVITTEGIGSLLVGQPADRTDMVERVVDYCADDDGQYGYLPGDPSSDRWIPAYPATSEGRTPFDVAVDHESGVVQRIDVLSSEIDTSEGAFVGAPLEILNAAYPDLQRGSSTELSDIYFIEGQSGVLVFEVGEGTVPGLLDTVAIIRVEQVGNEFDYHALNTDNVAGGCI